MFMGRLCGFEPFSLAPGSPQCHTKDPSIEDAPINGDGMTVAALIVAAGRGTRAGPGAPKQYRLLAGHPVLARTLAAFARHPGVDLVCAVIHAEDEAAYADAAAGIEGLLPPCHGGATRQASVRHGLESLAEFAPTKVLIHDGARPLVGADIIDRTLAALDTHVGAIAGLPVTDTVRRAPQGLCGETLPRDNLWRAQTPQGFRFEAILEAHRQTIDQELTDDGAVAAAAGLDCVMVEGGQDNMKITTTDDLARAERLLAPASSRTGLGFDVHRFGPGDAVHLCGVVIPHSHGLAGHSDADAGLHALTDALLGTIGAGDIGDHFPPSDPQWKGASSDRFLIHAAKLVRAEGCEIGHVDVTLICELPKIGPHREAMRAQIAKILDIDASRVSVKATTTEGLGFTGRGEGIAAQAVATVHTI